MDIRRLTQEDASGMAALMQESRMRNETLYLPLTAEAIAARFFCPGMQAFGFEREGKLSSFIHCAAKTSFLPGEDEASTPLYVTLILVAPEARGRGLGTALLEKAKEYARSLGKHSLHISGNNPLNLAWQIPGTPGHDHNNAPGAEVTCAGFDWLKRHGFSEDCREISLYIDLSEYISPDLQSMIDALAAQKIRVGFWQPGSATKFDGMCDRVGSEYWRRVLREELSAWKEGRPNAQPDLWPDGRCPCGPRPLLVAEHQDEIVGFTGPVDLQASGRGWFTGICVDPLYGRRGIATVLFHTLMQAFIEKGAAFSSLFTGKENHAQKIYRRAGMTQRAEFAVMTLKLDETACSQHYF